MDRELPEYLLRLRNQERLELIMSFYRGLKEFRDVARKTRSRRRNLRFEDIDHVIEKHLRPVKDTGHELFSGSQRGPHDGLLQAIFDMYFGVVFHVLLKAKENIRLQENYNVERLESLLNGMRKTDRGQHLPSDVGELFDSLRGEFERDSVELESEIESARFMFTKLEKIFNRIICVYDGNATIIRGLYCQRDFFAQLFPEEGVDRLFARIYPKNGPSEAYFLLGFDYLRSGHAVEAEKSFARALDLAQKRNLSAGRTRSIYRTYRERTLEESSESGDLALAVQVRLREMESQPPLKDFLANGF